MLVQEFKINLLVAVLALALQHVEVLFFLLFLRLLFVKGFNHRLSVCVVQLYGECSILILVVTGSIEETRVAVVLALRLLN